MKKMILMGSMIAALLTACSDDDDEDMNTLNSVDRTFLAQAARSNRAEIGAGQLAVTKGNNASVRAFGQQMVTEHTTAQTDLLSRATTVGYPVSDTLDAAHQALMQQLMTLSGRAFDSVYMRSQVNDHQQTMALFNSEITGGQHQQVKGYANQYLPAIQMHHHKADSLYNALF
jgi:putative membrane protein